MIIIYGTRGKELTGGQVSGIACKHCGEAYLSIFGGIRYFHVFWVPILITSRLFELRCSNCYHTNGKESFSKEEAKRVKQALFTPLRTLPYYTGSFLLLLAAIFIYSGSQERELKEAALLKSPQIHDVYRADLSIFFPEFDIDSYKYAAMEIYDIDSNGILFAISKESYESDFGLLCKIENDFPAQDDYYESTGVVIPYDEVVDLYRDGAVHGIHRFAETSNEWQAQEP